MVAFQVVATPNVAVARRANNSGKLGIALFHSGNPDLPGLGPWLRDMVFRGLPKPPSPAAWDFLSIAMSVYAADRFIPRARSDDGWTRVIDLEIAVRNPADWNNVSERLGRALRFLSGDIWHISFTAGGGAPPNFLASDSDRDTVCLFSGGLDSLLGAVDLVAQGKRPMLVSQGSPKEIGYQAYLADRIGLSDYRFEGRVSERGRPPYEPSSRARSILFFAYGLLAATSIGANSITVPENGLIAINPPLTPRRIGSLSTRTTHPYFLAELEQVWSAVGLGVALTNPFEAMTKGEMLLACSRKDISNLAANSYSCGKGKRINMQCGRCIPCVIRRGAFHKARLADRTGYYCEKLEQEIGSDDISSARLAIARMNGAGHAEFERWASMAGPLPADIRRRKKIVATAKRGLEEIRDFFDTVPWP